jgi:hypothetical protein
VRPGGRRSRRRLGWLSRLTSKDRRGPSVGWLVALAFVAQLLAPGVQCHPLSASAQEFGETRVDIAAAASAKAPCHSAPTHGPAHPAHAPCGGDDCCPTCQLEDFAVIPPSAMADIAFARLPSETVAAPARLGALVRPPAFSGRPRGPPVLI